MSSGSSRRVRAFFDDTYFRLHAPFFPEEQTRREVSGILELMGLPLGSRVLDAPCGWARHTGLLVEAGLDVVGADLSPAMLARARVQAPLVAADLRALPFPDASFAGALDVFTSLALLRDDACVRALGETLRVLEPGGVLLLECMNRDEVVAGYAERDRWVLPDGTKVRVRRRFDPVTGTSRERLRWRRGPVRGEKRHTLRLRTAGEVNVLLRAAGFVRVAWYGDWSGERLSHRSPRIIAVAHRTAGLLARHHHRP